MPVNRSQRRHRVHRNFVIMAAFALLVLIGFLAADYFERQNAVQERGELTSGIGQRKRVEYNGRTYVEKTNLTTILLMGVDNVAGTQSYGARQGGQADFLQLLVIDHTGKTIRQLQIDRDTITPVEMLGVLGNPVGTREMQISLSHGFGRTEVDCCNNTVKAAENLLEGVVIDYYMALNMDAIGKLNNVLGGVTVTLADDFSDADPAMVRGATLHLTDEQAEIFLRSRMAVGEGTNAERMARQRVYMSAAIDVMRAKLKDSVNFAGELFDALEADMTSSIKRGKMMNEANQAYNFEVLPVETLPGEHAIGRDGFMEFHVADGAAAEWVMQAYYDLLN
ncbi:MAG: LCP family protein [Clostridia bacterium]|nr:LCP family protein [Clostridia bacterium]